MMEADNGCAEFAGDEQRAPSTAVSDAPRPRTASREQIEAFQAGNAQWAARMSLDPAATLRDWSQRVHPNNSKLKALIAKMDADEAEAAAKKARAARRAQLLRALGLSWLEPERLDDYASEAGIAPDKLREAMATERGQRVAASMANKLRESGEALRVQTARATASLVTLIEQGIADGTVSPAMAPKIVESLAKLTASQESAEARNAKSPAAAIEGDLTGLIP